MRSHSLTLSVLLAAAAPARAVQGFAAVAFHDVVDTRAELDENAVTVEHLVGLLDWLRAHHWTAVSLDDVEAARLGRKPLPERAILLTFDDGYRSVYTRVYPLALAYRVPIVAAVVGSWLDAPMDGTVRYGDVETPRSRFVSWEELREMSGSGLVEIASHSQDLHRNLIGNPQGNVLPAAVTRLHAPDRGYESESAFDERIRGDLRRSRELLENRLGRAPRCIAWPFGRYDVAGVAIARELGFEFALTLDPGPADLSAPMAIARILPTDDPDLAAMVRSICFADALPRLQRFVALDPSVVWNDDPVEMDARLGRVIERLRVLGVTGVVLDAAEVDGEGRLTAAWFPTGQIALHADLLARLAWQCETRAGVSACVRLSSAAAARTLGGPERVLALFRDLGTYVPMSGLFVDDAPGLATIGSALRPDAAPWETRKARDAARSAALPEPAALALEAFHAVEAFRPGLSLVLLTDADAGMAPAPIADLTLFRCRPDADAARRLAERMRAAGSLAPIVHRRCGLWFTGDRPPRGTDLAEATRLFQILGGVATGWAADDPLGDRPAASIVAPAVSTATFPLRK